MKKVENDDEILDKLIGEAINERVNSIPIPDPTEEAWNHIQLRLRKERRRKSWIRRIKWISLTAASLLIGAFAFQSLQTTEAFRPMFEMVYKVKESGTILHIGSTEKQNGQGAKTPPPPDDDTHTPSPVKDNRDLPEEGTFRRVKVTLDEAVQQTQFVLPKPGYVPAGYGFQEATVHFSLGETKASAAKLVYLHDAAGQKLQIVVRKRSFSDNAKRQDGSRSLSELPSGGKELEWNDQDVNIIIQADVSEDELNKIADGMFVKR